MTAVLLPALLVIPDQAGLREIILIEKKSDPESTTGNFVYRCN